MLARSIYLVLDTALNQQRVGTTQRQARTVVASLANVKC